MVASRHRISHRSEFQRTLKTGVRVSTRDLTVHVMVVPASWPDPAGRRAAVDSVGGPWLGVIVSKSVGNAVVRHRVSRRLRHAFADASSSAPTPSTMVVLRARPSAAETSSTDLADQLRQAFAHRRIRAHADDVSASEAAVVWAGDSREVRS
ncbi:ribonuclease P protein component [Gordonia soli]|uniref:Ribonuclease P protein component n=1 Tax=Gordonia soli NBRC 108243 TaxID=1223545 RepID=M0QDU5_9ACTN|nr:ribonuclease P protein component [Gordonia soli]GAC66768.1 ribonuclease P protein component [Gordonia soli NBRC 108243]